MILQTGMRTDIPAFYTPWLLNRLKAGFVLVRSPYAPGKVTRYSLSPSVVDLIGFCTKNPRPMLPHLDALRVYPRAALVGDPHPLRPGDRAPCAAQGAGAPGHPGALRRAGARIGGLAV